MKLTMLMKVMTGTAAAAVLSMGGMAHAASLKDTTTITGSFDIVSGCTVSAVFKARVAPSTLNGFRSLSPGQSSQVGQVMITPSAGCGASQYYAAFFDKWGSGIPMGGKATTDDGSGLVRLAFGRGGNWSDDTTLRVVKTNAVIKNKGSAVPVLPIYFESDTKQKLIAGKYSFKLQAGVYVP